MNDERRKILEGLWERAHSGGLREHRKDADVDCALSALDKLEAKITRSLYQCNGCPITCQVLMDKACDDKPNACLFSEIAKKYNPKWLAILGTKEG